MRRTGRHGGAAWIACVLLLPCALAGCGVDETPPELGPVYDASGRAHGGVEIPTNPPNLVLIVVDALRHDALAPDGGADPAARMPHLASLAARGVAFDNAAAAAPWTLPSMTSLLTGLQPSAHGLHTPQSQVHLVDAITTYAEILRTTYGYDTAAFTAGPWFVGSGASILQGFALQQGDFSLRDVQRQLWQWSRVRNPRRPFFLLLHTYDAHDPYGEANHPWGGRALPDVRSDPSLFGPAADEGEIFRRCFLDAGITIALREELGRGPLAGILHRYAHSGYKAAPRPALAADLEGAYWDGVQWTDGLLAQTTAWLGRQGLLGNTLLVVTSDHGEGFGEHGSLAHGRLLTDELVRVPLVMVGPEPFTGGEVVTSSVGLVDVLPTFFDWAGLRAHVGVEGRSHLALLDVDRGCRPVLSEERLGFLNTGEQRDAIRLSARTDHWKYILTYDVGTGATFEEVYDLLVDPDEVDDLGGGTGSLPEGLVFDDCFCEAVQTLRARIWSETASGPEDASHIPYGTSNRQPVTRRPAPCVGRVE